mmetsp:Transcript_10069/g.35561  ORF Transcript_10069/g.35561 Transcript_10069/m.35561 type:complete len:220 (-) Transcript_10069:65-724(-)
MPLLISCGGARSPRIGARALYRGAPSVLGFLPWASSLRPHSQSPSSSSKSAAPSALRWTSRGASRTKSTPPRGWRSRCRLPRHATAGGPRCARSPRPPSSSQWPCRSRTLPFSPRCGSRRWKLHSRCNSLRSPTSLLGGPASMSTWWLSLPRRHKSRTLWRRSQSGAANASTASSRRFSIRRCPATRRASESLSASGRAPSRSRQRAAHTCYSATSPLA